ncbi:hypothetical protein GI374_04415 [Paracoccus sp. S-4012]|uniref:MotE family protein n=1 Tax=Paracoccus sp. S-4012 TaxID=2665648 RepID=UPI0012B08562|nr:hypothetical protein [Paracoccus sp. S-4012]MRX49703.1 hypothetical protein [Paracoccus sp. S-4012]
MRRRRRLLPALAGCFMALGAMQGVSALGSGDAAASRADLLAGCRDIPEAVDLAALLELRSQRMEAYQAALDRSRAEIATAQSTLTAKLRELKAVRDGMGATGQAQRTAVTDDIDRLVGVYDAMKPRDAAAVLNALPPDFAAEILMRIDPAAGAQILAAVDPVQAAVLTTHMGARSVRRN